VKLYIAGPMSGYPHFNYGAFHEAGRQLTARGFDVLNPAANPECHSWDGYMRASIAQVIQADGIVALPDWQMSAGATLEVHIAQTLHMPVHSLNHWLEQA
jgi:hypothetical protein